MPYTKIDLKLVASNLLFSFLIQIEQCTHPNNPGTINTRKDSEMKNGMILEQIIN